MLAKATSKQNTSEEENSTANHSIYNIEHGYSQTGEVTELAHIFWLYLVGGK